MTEFQSIPSVLKEFPQQIATVLNLSQYSRLALYLAALRHIMETDKKKLSKRIGYLNKCGTLQKPIGWNQVISRLMNLDLGQAMNILGTVEEKAASLQDPTAFILHAISNGLGPMTGHIPQTTSAEISTKISPAPGRLAQLAAMHLQGRKVDLKPASAIERSGSSTFRTSPENACTGDVDSRTRSRTPLRRHPPIQQMKAGTLDGNIKSDSDGKTMKAQVQDKAKGAEHVKEVTIDPNSDIDSNLASESESESSYSVPPPPKKKQPAAKSSARQSAATSVGLANLPTGWESVVDMWGRVYFFHRGTGTTQWTHPAMKR